MLRFAPGAGGALLAALDAALSGDAGHLGGAATAAGSNAERCATWPSSCSGAGEDVVIVFGERLLRGPRGAGAARALLNVATRLGLAAAHGAGLLEVPSPPTGAACARRGSRRATAPGYATLEARRPRRRRDRRGPRSGELSALYLLHSDPLRASPDRAKWEARWARRRP